MLSLILRIITSGISHFYYFIYTVYASCLQFCLSLCLGKGKQTHNSHFCLVFSLQPLVHSLGRMPQCPLTANKAGTAHLV